MVTPLSSADSTRAYAWLHTPLSAVVAAAECVRLLCAAAGDWVRRFRVGGLVSVWFTRQVVKTEALGACCACGSESCILILISSSDMKAARAAGRVLHVPRVPYRDIGTSAALMMGGRRTRQPERVLHAHIGTSAVRIATSNIGTSAAVS